MAAGHGPAATGAKSVAARAAFGACNIAITQYSNNATATVAILFSIFWVTLFMAAAIESAGAVGRQAG